MTRPLAFARPGRRLAALLSMLASLPALALMPAPPDTAMDASRPAARVRITNGQQTLTATLARTRAAADFASLLPIEVSIEDYASTEKIAYLPRKLDLHDAPAGTDPSVLDLAYYAPWGNLAMYYRDASYARGLVHLGRFDGDAVGLQRLAPGRYRIEVLGDPTRP